MRPDFAKLHAFTGNTRGSVSIVFGLMLLPMLTIIGIAVDYGRLSHFHSTLQSAADNAAQSVLDKLHAPASELRPRITAALDANLPEDLRGVAFTQTVDADRGTVSIEIESRLATPMLGLIGRSTADVRVVGEACTTPQERAVANLGGKAKGGPKVPPSGADPEAARRLTEALGRLGTGRSVPAAPMQIEPPTDEQMRRAEQLLQEIRQRLQR